MKIAGFFGELIETKKPCKPNICRALAEFVYLDAEREGFEPPDLLQSIVFKTTAIDHSAISPGAKLYKQVDFQKRISLQRYIYYKTMLNTLL